MGRILIAMVVAVGIFLGIAWAVGVFEPSKTEGNDAKAPTAAQRKLVEFGDPLYTGKLVPDNSGAATANEADPIIIAGAHLSTIDHVDIPSRYDGKLLFIGKRIAESTTPLSLTGRKDAKQIMVAEPLKQGKKFFVYYKKLNEGDFIDETDMVALVDPTLPWGQLQIKVAKVKAADAEYKGAMALQEVYQGELERLDKIIQSTGRRDSVSASEYAVARAQRDKYKEEANSKAEAISVARDEKIEADTIVALHYLQNTLQLPGGSKMPPKTLQIKTIYKNQGEAVKQLEPVLQLQYLGRLRAEGLVDVQYLHDLAKDMKVIVEPSRRREPLRTFAGHLGEINAVAVSSDPKNPVIISGSEDKTVRVWKKNQQGEYKIWYLNSPVKAVVCTPPGATDAGSNPINHCLTACADGSVWLWDLNKLTDKTEKPVELVWKALDQHGDAINCLAFSPDGKWYATGGEDNAIDLWRTENHKLKYRFDSDKGHQGAVTSLHFTPDAHLVSAGHDNTVRKWELREKGAVPEGEIDKRGGNVNQLGVSSDGRYMLFDQGKGLKVMSRQNGRTIGVIQDPGETAPFETFAIFSPDAALILTASSSEGRIQLWRSPTIPMQDKEPPRSFEVRQFVPKEASQPTCAAFGKAGGDVFAVTGTKDGHVYLWAVPNKEQVDQRLQGTISYIEASVDSARQARIWVEVDNRDPARRLTPGEAVNIVVPRKLQ